jgi:hypothetical protein
MKIGPNPDSLHPDDERTAFQAVHDFRDEVEFNFKHPEGAIKDLEVLADRLATMCAKISTLEEKNAELNARLSLLEAL